MQVKNIVLPLFADQSFDPCLQPLLNLASGEGAAITLVSVIDDKALASSASGLSRLELYQLAEQAETERLNTARSKMLQAYPQLDIEVQILLGKAFVKVVELSQQENSDLIVISAPRLGYRHAPQFDSFAKHLMRKCPAPVWAMSPRRSGQLRRIVAAVDVTALEPEGQKLNRQILQSAIFLSRHLGGEVCLLHAWHLFGEQYLSTWGGKKPVELAVMAQKERDARVMLLSQLLDEVKGCGVTIDVQLKEGLPEVVIPDFIREQGVDLLVMGTLCRTGLPGFLIGNTAEAMLDSVDCSVLTLKPEGFKSPVLITDTL